MFERKALDKADHVDAVRLALVASRNVQARHNEPCSLTKLQDRYE